jgi:hypothetical protein
LLPSFDLRPPEGSCGRSNFLEIAITLFHGNAGSKFFCIAFENDDTHRSSRERGFNITGLSAPTIDLTIAWCITEWTCGFQSGKVA